MFKILLFLKLSLTSILMISSELPEILGMSDRIYVMHEGCISGEFSKGASSEEILRCAMGVN